MKWLGRHHQIVIPYRPMQRSSIRVRRVIGEDVDCECPPSLHQPDQAPAYSVALICDEDVWRQHSGELSDPVLQFLALQRPQKAVRSTHDDGAIGRKIVTRVDFADCNSLK